MAGERAVDVPEHRAGARPDTPAAIEDLDAGEVAADVDEDAGALRLAVEARPGGAEGERDALPAGEAEELRDLAGVAGGDDGPRDHPVRARIRGVADEVDRPAQDPVLAEECRERAVKRAVGSGGELVRNPVGRT